MDMKLEVVVVPVSDVDRAKGFYQALGWRLDADFATGPDFRVVQLTPPGSDCSVIFGTGITSAAPGSAEGLQLTTRLPGRVTPAPTAFGSASDLAGALRRAEAAHGRHEQEIGHADPDWPAWYAQYMVDEQAGS